MMPSEADLGRNAVMAQTLADSLPIECAAGDDDCGDLISLQDIVVTAVDHNEFNHFRVRKYAPDGASLDLTTRSVYGWAIVEPLLEGLKEGQRRLPVSLDVETVRAGVKAYAYSRLNAGMSYEDVRQCVDGSYTDVIIADAIVQMAVYGEVVFG